MITCKAFVQQRYAARREKQRATQHQRVMQQYAFWLKEAKDVRAFNFLWRNLNPQQRSQFATGNSFEVWGGKTKTRYSLTLRDVFGWGRGNTYFRWCLLVGDGEIPVWDVILAKKLLIEGNEDLFLATAVPWK